MNLRNLGAGMPDGGLFTPDQFQRQADGAPKAGQLPSRGAIEAKGTRPDVKAIAESRQVKEYLRTYGIVIVTNLREFLLVQRGADWLPVPRERFALAGDEEEFWRHKAAHPRATAQQKGAQFVEFIKRACLHAAPLINAKDVAWFMASYARDALFRVEQQKQLPALQSVRTALEDALGMKCTDEEGEHFFRSTLVQTLFYGVFSAWVRWHKDNPGTKARFDWRTAEWSLHVPFIRTLYEEVAKPSRLGPLGLVETLDWAAGVLNRVDRGEFFRSFEDEHAVQYFYEPFLEAYDPELRKALGVWYTPPEIVEYQVARVDAVLREELDLPDGLADPNVVVLDPCCGTGAYLVEVLRQIERTLRDKQDNGLVGHDVKTAARDRVFGFEIMPAPFVIAHLQIGLLLQQVGSPLSTSRGERAAVYLTNALTGWEPPKGAKQKVAQWADLEEERDAAAHVKRDERILVVLGNPPYNAFAGVSPEEEEGLVEVYKGVYYQEQKTSGNKNGENGVKRVKRYKLNDPPAMGGWGIKKFNLDDLYVRFFRLAERRIAEMSGRGVVSFISNHSWISEPSFVVMRQRLLESFDKFWIENLHGNRKISEYAPDGRTSETIFAISGFSVGIQQGVATSLWVKTGKPRRAPGEVRFRDDIDSARAEERRKQLLKGLTVRRFDAAYATAEPCAQNRFSFKPESVSSEYNAWPKVPELAISHFNGPVERRGGALVSIDRGPLDARMEAYFDPEKTDEEIKAICPSLMMTGNRIVGPEARKKILAEHTFDATKIVKYPFKVFDVRFCYLENLRPLFSEPSPELLGHRIPGNRFFITRDTADKTPEGPPFYFSSRVCDYDCISGHARHFPVVLSASAKPAGRQAEDQGSFLTGDVVANLSPLSCSYLALLGVESAADETENARLVWMHALAIGYSPAYLSENADGIRRDWPRIPLPADRKMLEASAALGEELAALLDSETDVAGVTSERIDPILKTLGVICNVGSAETGLAVTAGWGHKGKEGVTMPAKGKLAERDYSEAEAQAVEAEAAARGTSGEDVRRLLGGRTLDVYLNGAACWRNIPLNVWEYCIGGYQVVKKWLSYREVEILGRALKPEEAREVMNMARRLAAIVLMQPALDENYRRVKAATYAWPTKTHHKMPEIGGSSLHSTTP
jgi:hypothetical protein